MTAFDIIGDIHGHYAELIKLFKLLGYRLAEESREKGPYYFHPQGRKAIFIGDLIDRGPENLKVIQIVSHMVEKGTALAIMGNHEYNCLAWHTQKDSVIHGKSFGDFSYLRPHTQKNRELTQHTLREFSRSPYWKDRCLEWIMSLPLFLELEGIQLVHACWDDRQIEYLKQHLTRWEGEDCYGYCLTDSFLQKSAVEGSPEYWAVEILLKGKEGTLPEGLPLKGSDGRPRKKYRIKWWLSPEEVMLADDLAGLALIPREEAMKLPDEKWLEQQKRQLSHECGYGKERKPLFIGHYWFEGVPQLLKNNLACIDYSVASGGRLAAYSWNGEASLYEKNFTWVEKANE